MAVTFSGFLIVCGSLSLISMLMSEIFEWIQLLIQWSDHHHHTLIPVHDYSTDNRFPNLAPDDHQTIQTNQFPINIVTRDSVVLEESEQLKWIGYSVRPVAITMLNDGKTVSVQCIWPADVTPYIESGPLRNLYDFQSIVFHWGSSNDSGSEHTLDNVSFPLEMQLIHVKTDLETLHTEIDRANTSEITIISFFFQCSEVENHQLANIITSLSSVKDEESKVSITPFSLDTIFPLFASKFYTYNGFSSAFPYVENVIRIINPEPLNISTKQVEEFRKICSSTHDNTEKVHQMQALSDRAVYYYE